MIGPARLAVYYAPPQTSGLAAFAAAWLGRDLAGREVPRLAVPGIDADQLARVTAEPRRYGFHATLKAPFRPGRNVSPADLGDRLGHIAAAEAPVAAGPLALTAIGPFLALCPTGDTAAIGVLAGRLVRDLDDFRAPLSDAERARRNPARLTARQRHYLERWGYPYVFEEFRFHLTLTGPIADAAERESVRAALEPLVAPFCAAPFALDEIALFADPGDGGLFALAGRHTLAGRSNPARTSGT